MKRRQFLTLITSAALCAGPGMALASAPAKKKGGGASFAQLPLITVFTPGAGGGRHGTLTVEVGLDVKEEKLRDSVRVSMPRLRDAYVARLQAYALSLHPRALADLEYVTRELQTATDTVLKHKGAKVLLGTLMLN